MTPPDEGSGLGWIGLVFFGFVAGYLLAKLKLLSYNNVTRFCTWVSAAVAAVVAMGGVINFSSAIDIGGRLAIFMLIWLVFGLVFTLGTLLGIEKAEKKSPPRHKSE
ncbi:hypothetical protein RE432_14970 [Pusillimonas sp. SM2304]|uniref:hypothetical protein n=1 Tax=Pusillimonas sp. SM2304 TaxID=3073241 RepID=UPI0028751A6B|nr:hypothetical protein [Pusillimonas sp. SM2304]MDS1141741.1 hypothetical protein [Pusillimonas sp. SM2304]